MLNTIYVILNMHLNYNLGIFPSNHSSPQKVSPNCKGVDLIPQSPNLFHSSVPFSSTFITFWFLTFSHFYLYIKATIYLYSKLIIYIATGTHYSTSQHGILVDAVRTLCCFFFRFLSIYIIFSFCLHLIYLLLYYYFLIFNI